MKRDLQRGKFADFSPTRIRTSLFHPFCKKFFYFDPILNQDIVRWPEFLPTQLAEAENRIICVAGVGNRKGFGCLLTNHIAYLDLAFEKCQCFPFYVFDKDGSNRRENITDWALKQFRTRYADDSIGKWDIFYYVYGLLHHPGYRERYADNLKRELPRIPFAPDFRAFADAGRKLAEWHLGYETVEPWPLKWVEAAGEPLSYRVQKMKLTKDKSAVVVNNSLTLTDVPPEALRYRLGNRSALEWVIDQYQVSEDSRSGIRSDPNRPDDEQYIVRLVERVVRVSVETVNLVAGLPADFGAESEPKEHSPT